MLGPIHSYRTTEGTPNFRALGSVQPATSSAALTTLTCSWTYKAERRLVELYRLPVGWDGHKGLPAKRDVVEFAASVLGQIMLPNVPMPAIMPLSHGGVQIEWHRKGWDIEIEISAPNTLHIYQHELATGKETEFELAADLGNLRATIESIRD